MIMICLRVALLAILFAIGGWACELVDDTLSDLFFMAAAYAAIGLVLFCGATFALCGFNWEVAP